MIQRYMLRSLTSVVMLPIAESLYEWTVGDVNPSRCIYTRKSAISSQTQAAAFTYMFIYSSAYSLL